MSTSRSDHRYRVSLIRRGRMGSCPYWGVGVAFFSPQPRGAVECDDGDLAVGGVSVAGEARVCGGNFVE